MAAVHCGIRPAAPRLADVFNIQGSELVFLLLIALIVLGPEKLPDAIRKFGRAYGEFKKMANGFQGELTKALDEPMRELRDTADAMRAAANFDTGNDPATPAAPATSSTPATPGAPAATAPAAPQGLNFGSANPRRVERAAQAEAGAAAAAGAPAAAPSAAPAAEAPKGLNFGIDTARPTIRQIRKPKPAPDAAAEHVPDPVPAEPAAVDPVAEEPAE